MDINKTALKLIKDGASECYESEASSAYLVGYIFGITDLAEALGDEPTLSEEEKERLTEYTEWREAYEKMDCGWK